uniref:Uncharacterized protein n=1 Tax=Neogobius melanostomus TaxID=47308 RepID=A0A8C6SU27_9GOBI
MYLLWPSERPVIDGGRQWKEEVRGRMRCVYSRPCLFKSQRNCKQWQLNQTW